MKKIVGLSIITVMILCTSFGFIKNGKISTIEDKSIVFASGDIPNNLKKISSLSKEDENIICAVSRGLVQLNEKDGIESSLAGNISVSNDGIEYDFTIHEDVYWSDGNRITAEDYKEYFKQLLNTEEEENISALLNVYGAKEFKNGKGSFDELVAISCEDNVLKMRLNKKNNNFLRELTRPQYRLRKYPELWEDIKSAYNNISYSGEYSINSINNKSIVLKKNQYIKDKIAPSIKYIKDESSELSMASYEVGERDVVFNPPVSELSKLKDEERIKTCGSNKGIYLFMQQDKNLSLEDRRGLYKLIYDATEVYESNYSEEIKAAYGVYYSNDLSDLNKIQARKKSINSNFYWKKPKKVKLAIIDDCGMSAYYNFLIKYFKENNVLLECSYLKSENNNDEVNNYDMCIFSGEINDYDREKLFDSFKEIFNIDISMGNKEDKLFFTYTLVPIMFINNNIAISDKIIEIKIDGNGNIDFSSLKENRVDI